jgi:hypothetical protein
MRGTALGVRQFEHPRGNDAECPRCCEELLRPVVITSYGEFRKVALRFGNVRCSTSSPLLAIDHACFQKILLSARQQVALENRNIGARFFEQIVQLAFSSLNRSLINDDATPHRK